MKILALNPFHGGSHRAFLNGWIKGSRHQFDLETLSAHHWKWRMRQGAIHFANKLKHAPSTETEYDLLFCTDMLNLAEFRGLAKPSLANLPAVVYFHENQLTYPVQEERERDLHFAFSNFLTAHSADAIWFNSGYHQHDFLTALENWLPRMPEGKSLLPLIPALWEKSEVHSPGINIPECEPAPRSPSQKPLHLVWVSRWEHDKGPEIFFEALRLLQQRGTSFQVSVLGESYAQTPEIFAEARNWLKKEIMHWGYLEDYTEYQNVLRTADMVVSTANHEFFGIAVLEAVAAGCRPLVPDALAYPEVLPSDRSFFHDNQPGTLANILEDYAGQLTENRHVDDQQRVTWYQFVRKYGWNSCTGRMDAALERILRS
ncbi:MAG: DUF3524 domain-containing protein [Planctomycetaceae bacterium]